MRAATGLIGLFEAHGVHKAVALSPQQNDSDLLLLLHVAHEEAQGIIFPYHWWGVFLSCRSNCTGHGIPINRHSID